MSPERPCPVYVWWTVAVAGMLGLLLAVDALAVFLFLLLATAASGAPANPYVGALAFLLVPALIVIGIVGAWGAYQFCTDNPRPKRSAATAVQR